MDGRGDGGRGSGSEDTPREDEGFKYRLYVAPEKALSMYLVFHPTSVGQYEFPLGFNMPGLHEADRNLNLVRTVVAKALKPRLVLSQSVVDFKNKVVIKEGTNKTPNRMMLKLFNEDDADLEWELVVGGTETDLAVQEVFRLEPVKGKLASGHSAQVHLMFSPLEVRPYEMHIPVYLDRNRETTYTTIVVKGNGCCPSLVFDRQEVSLPVTPVGVPSKAMFFVANEGYEQLEVKAQLPFADTNKIPLTFTTPEGTLLNATRSSFPVEVTMLSKKPMSFTVGMEFLDEEGNKFTIPISGCCDNSILTVFPRLHLRGPDTYAFEAEEGKPVVYTEADDTDNGSGDFSVADTPRSAASRRTNATSRSMESDSAMSALDRFHRKVYTKKAADRLRNFLNVNVLQEPLDDLVLGLSGMLGRPLVEAIEVLYGRAPPGKQVPDKLSPVKSTASMQLLKMYEDILHFLRGFGAQLSEVKAEYMVRYEDYNRIIAADPTGTNPAGASSSDAFAVPFNTSMSVRSMRTTTGNPRRLSERRFMVRATHAWMTVMLQVIKVFYLVRVAWKSFKSQPMTEPMSTASAAENWPQSEKMPPSLVGSNIFSTSECLLLKWLDLHFSSVPTVDTPTKDKDKETSAEPPEPPLTRITSFGSQLLDGRVFASVLQAYIPYLAKRFAQSVDGQFVWNPRNPAEKDHNLKLVLDAMKEVGLPNAYTVKDLHEFGQPEMLLFVFNMYLNLPQYIPKATIAFKGFLRQTITRTIELKNPTKFALDYDIFLHGSEEFKYDGTRVHLDPSSTANFVVTITPRFRATAKARLTFLCRRVGSISATMVFDLVTDVTHEGSTEVRTLETPLYEPLNTELFVENPFPISGRFLLTIRQERLPPEVSESPRGRGSARTRVTEESSASQFPEPFFSATDILSIKKLDRARMVLQFLPFVRGTYRCLLVFQDDKVGEFVMQFVAKVGPPLSYEKLHILAESGPGGAVAASISKEVPFYARNPNLERALGILQDRYKQFRTREKRQIAQSVLDAIDGSVKYTVAYSSPFYAGPKEYTAMGQKARLDKTDALTPTLDDTKDGKPKMKAKAMGMVQSLVPIMFNPKGPGLFPGKIIFTSAYDVRVIEIEGRCRPPSLVSELDFACPARQIVSQDIPITNPTDKERIVTCLVSGDYFSGVREVRVPAGRTKAYTLTFSPPWVCEVTGTLTLRNSDSADKSVWTIRGKAEEPLAENTLNLECQARSSIALTLNVSNITSDTVTYTVESDLDFLEGAPTVTVGRGEVAKYECALRPPMWGKFIGAVTFRAPTQQYLWYVINLDVSRPPPEASLDISAHVRKAAAAEIEIANPADTPVRFTVQFVGDGLVGDSVVALNPGQSKLYQLMFRPFSSGTWDGTVSFISDEVGEFWYQLHLTALEPEVEDLGLIQAELGKSKSVTVILENPVGQTIPLVTTNTNEINFQTTPSPLVLRPHARLPVTIAYSPSALAVEQDAIITFSSPLTGKWTYLVKGIGVEPTPMDPTDICSAVGHTESVVLAFRNPFPLVKRVLVSLRPSDDDVPGAELFNLIMKRRSHTLEPFATLQIPVSYSPRLITQNKAVVMVQLLGEQPEQGALAWQYPLVGVAEGVPVKLPIKFCCQARKENLQVIAVPLSELDCDITEQSFTYELRVPPAAEHRSAIQRGITVSRCTFEEYKAYMRRDRIVEDPSVNPEMIKTHLFFNVTFVPLRPFSVVVDLVISKTSGGQWKFALTFEALPPDPDDVILIDAPLNKTESVAFHLSNIFSSNDPFTAYFAPGSPADFTVIPTSGVLLAA
eukprot:RCo041844